MLFRSMSLVTFIGPKPNLLALDETKPTIRLEASQPVLTLDDLEQLKNISKLTKDAFKSLVLDITYDVKGLKKDDAYGMKKAIDMLRQDAHKAVKDGYNILILSDRNQSKDRIAIPALLATSATHQHLVREG